MNTTRESPDTAAAEHEWALQERALDAERRGDPPSGDARVDRYRAVARALREPVVPLLPPDFARRVATKARAAAAFDDRVERRAIALTVGLLVVAGAVWLGRDTDALAALPVARTLANSWVLALAACLGTSYFLSWWGKRSAAV